MVLGNVILPDNFKTPKNGIQIDFERRNENESFKGLLKGYTYELLPQLYKTDCDLSFKL
jgi:hypothetical protein